MTIHKDRHLVREALERNDLSDWQKEFLKSVSAQLKRDAMLTDKQRQVVLWTIDGWIPRKPWDRDPDDDDQTAPGMEADDRE